MPDYFLCAADAAAAPIFAMPATQRHAAHAFDTRTCHYDAGAMLCELMMVVSYAITPLIYAITDIYCLFRHCYFSPLLRC